MQVDSQDNSLEITSKHPVKERKKEPEKDYRSLSQSLLKTGEFRLLCGDYSGVHYFDMAEKLDPANPTLFYHEGLSLLEHGIQESHVKSLRNASKKLKRASVLDPYQFEVWHIWGNTLYHLGEITKEHHYFLDAKEKLKKAIDLSKNESNDTLADLHQDYGNTWLKLADNSGEAVDLFLALQAYEEASKYDKDLPADFFRTFGLICLKLGNKTNDTRFLLKSIDCYKNAISIDISSYLGWYELAKAVKTLYSYTHDEDHFSQANECFTAAVQFNSTNPEIWLEWAILLLQSGKFCQDPKRLQASMEKCKKCAKCDTKNPKLLSTWSEAMAIYGVLTDKLEYIHNAQSKLKEVYLEDEYIIHAEGVCLFSLGKYFNDLDYYYQSIEKFQEGLSINRSSHRLWHAIGSTYMITAQFEDETRSYERAAKFFQKALHLKVSSYYNYQYATALFKLGEITKDRKLVYQSLEHFEQALNLQKNAVYLHPDWLFVYACALDTAGDYEENEGYYVKSLEILSHVLTVDPDFTGIHYQIAVVYSHYGELTEQTEYFQRAIHHFRIASTKDPESDSITLDWAITLVNLAETCSDSMESGNLYHEAEYKMIQAAKLGNVHAYYQLACLYSLIGTYEKSFYFLEKAHEFETEPSLKEVLEDEWLEGLRGTDLFRSYLESKQNLLD